jgi:exonuclease SbcC
MFQIVCFYKLPLNSQLHLQLNINSEKLEYLEAKIKVLKYEKDRMELQDNEPCPLCGSLNHPYKINAPKVDEKEYRKLQEELKKDEKEVKEIEQEISIINKWSEENSKELKVAKNKIEEIEKSFENKNIKVFEFDELKKQKEESDKNLEIKNKIESDIKVLSTRIEENSKVIKEKSIQLKEIDNAFKNLEVEYKTHLQNARVLKEELVKKVGQFDNVYDKKDKLIQKNQELNELFNNKLQSLNEIENKINTNNKLKEEKSKKIVQNNIKLENITIEDKDYETLKNEISGKIRNFSEELGKTVQIITNIQKDIEKFKELNSQKEKLNVDLKLYTKLNDLIGSSDGKKFKKIAINFMMQELIYIANIHLDKLSNHRYVFENNDDIEKLDLFVIDKFNENQKRGVATLSGGESFLASLALSFGLSDMIRQTVQIETLFLDEGFGSLDNNTLSNALNILKDASAGKMIGIISHVDSLKEEISKQIQVIKKANGRSDLKII